jgi:hypothetical protein
MVRTCARTLDGGSRAPVPSVRPSVTWARLNNGTTSTGPKQSEVRARCTRQFLNSSTSTPPSSRGLGVSRRLRRSSRRTLASPGLDGLDGPSLTRVGSGQWQSTAGRARALTNERRCASATEPSRPPNPRGTGCIALHWRRRAALVLVDRTTPRCRVGSRERCSQRASQLEQCIGRSASASHVAALALGLERDRNGDRRLSETTERDRSSCGFGDLNLVFVLSSSLGASVGLGVAACPGMGCFSSRPTSLGLAANNVQSSKEGVGVVMGRSPR